MRAELAYQSLTELARRQAIKTISAMLKAEGVGRRRGRDEVSPGYVRQVLCGIRQAPCSEDISRVISAYFVGLGIAVLPEEVTGMPGEPIDGTGRSVAA